MTDPKVFGFRIHSLDMDLAKMQFQMLKRMKDMKPHKLSPLVETFDSNYASRGFRKTTLSIRECEHNEDGILYMAEFAIGNERSIYVTSKPLYRGSWKTCFCSLTERSASDVSSGTSFHFARHIPNGSTGS